MAERRSYGKEIIYPKGASGSYEITVTLKDRAGWTTTDTTSTNINFLWDRASVGDYVRLDLGAWEDDFDAVIDARISLSNIVIGAEKGRSADNRAWGWRIVHIASGGQPYIYLWHTSVTAYATITWGNKLNSALLELGRWCDRTYGHDSKGRSFLSAYIPGWNGSSPSNESAWTGADSLGMIACGKDYWTFASSPNNNHSSDYNGLYISGSGSTLTAASGLKCGVRPVVTLPYGIMCEPSQGSDQCGHTAWVLK